MAAQGDGMAQTLGNPESESSPAETLRGSVREDQAGNECLTASRHGIRAHRRGKRNNKGASGFFAITEGRRTPEWQAQISSTPGPSQIFERGLSKFESEKRSYLRNQVGQSRVFPETDRYESLLPEKNIKYQHVYRLRSELGI
jgi:hypothetical protein